MPGIATEVLCVRRYGGRRGVGDAEDAGAPALLSSDNAASTTLRDPGQLGKPKI